MKKKFYLQKKQVLLVKLQLIELNNFKKLNKKYIFINQ